LDYVIEFGVTKIFEPWHIEDEEMKQKREAEEMGDTMKTLDSKREMVILAAFDEMK